MKRLLILGGSRYVIPVIKSAHNLGVHVITADYLPNNIAHKYSDEYCNISITEKEKLLEKAKELKIDGITSFACDPGVVTAAYVAEKMKLPTCGTYENICILQNKYMFRRFLSENGFNTPKAKGYTCITDALKDVNYFDWPIIIKPTDSAGSKGVKRVDTPDEMEEAMKHALLFSRTKEFIIEDYIPQKGFSSDTDCFSVDGSLKFVSFNSQRFDINADNPYVPSAYSWPSSMSEKHQEELTSEIQRLIKLLGLGSSIFNIETREGMDGKAYIMECSPRGGGNRLAECLEFATGLNLIENVVRVALDMNVTEITQKSYDGFWAEVILHSNEDGLFEKLWISEEIETNVFEIDLWVETGTKVQRFSSANYAIGTVVLKFGDESILQRVMQDINRYIKVIVKNAKRG